MAIWAMSDLHLAISTPDKTMEAFGSSWGNYIARIEEGIKSKVSDDDTILMPGDLSWVMHVKDGYEDFKFINDLPGKKIISRGNHDYFWTTVKKIEDCFSEFGFSNILISRNNVFEIEDSLITGTRGWMLPSDDSFSSEDRKVLNREILRLNACLKAMCDMDPEHKKRHVLMLHYPPLNKIRMRSEFTEVIDKYDVDVCVYGHLHGRAHQRVFEGDHNGVVYKCVSADYLGFVPVEV